MLSNADRWCGHQHYFRSHLYFWIFRFAGNGNQRCGNCYSGRSDHSNAVGIPTIIMQSMSSVMCFGINKLLLDFSTTSTAVFGAYFKLQTFVYMAIFGLNNALIGLIGLIIMEMLPVQLISVFAPSEEMFSLGVGALRILGLSFVFGGISVMTCYALQGFSRGISSLIISA